MAPHPDDPGRFERATVRVTTTACMVAASVKIIRHEWQSLMDMGAVAIAVAGVILLFAVWYFGHGRRLDT